MVPHAPITEGQTPRPPQERKNVKACKKEVKSIASTAGNVCNVW